MLLNKTFSINYSFVCSDMLDLYNYTREGKNGAKATRFVANENVSISDRPAPFAPPMCWELGYTMLLFNNIMKTKRKIKHLKSSVIH
jgi:hypothetical protein